MPFFSIIKNRKIQNPQADVISAANIVFSGNTLDECFDFLSKVKVEKRDRYNIVVPRSLAKNFGASINSNVDFLYDVSTSPAAWRRWNLKNIFRKIFHPGNSLTIAFILTAVGLGLIGFSVICPPALVFTSLGFAAFSAVSAVGYTIDWLVRDYKVYQGRARAISKEPNNYINDCKLRLKAWVINHKAQAVLMGIGLAIFLGALIVTVGYFIAPAVFAFMTMGIVGGAIGLTTSFFGATGVLPAVMCSVLAGATLVLGPVNILDSIRRLVSGIYRVYKENKQKSTSSGNAPKSVDDETKKRDDSEKENKKVECYKKAVDNGSVDAMYNLEHILGEHRELEKNVVGYVGTVPFQLKKQAKAEKTTTSQATEKREIQTADIEKELDENYKDISYVKDLVKRVQKGDPEGQALLGFCYENGEGVPKDLKKAVHWYKQSAAQNNAKGQYYLAFCYESGIGVSKNLSKAAKYYNMAAQQGHENSQKDLADLLKNNPELTSELVTYAPKSPFSSSSAQTNNNPAQVATHTETLPATVGSPEKTL